MKRIFSVVVYALALVGLGFLVVFAAMQLNLTKSNGGIDTLSKHYNETISNGARRKDAQESVKDWASTPEWQVISAGFMKDKDLIKKASRVSGVPARVILSSVIVEQFRYFTSNREVFKSVFQPLQVLGNATKFSYGVAGIKIATAKTVESNLKNKKSPYYLGSSYSDALDFKTDNPDKERMDRLTDPDNHYYSYLYTGILLKEEMKQWSNAGYSLSNRPEILATLFNLGFSHSKPNSKPQTGGATISIDGKNYTFGSLAYNFYYSDVLTDEFPN